MHVFADKYAWRARVIMIMIMIDIDRANIIVHVCYDIATCMRMRTSAYISIAMHMYVYNCKYVYIREHVGRRRLA